MSRSARKILGDGLAAGLIGFATVVAVFVVADALAGRPLLFTPALLGGALFYEVTDPAAVAVTSGPVLRYSVVHLVVFVVIGMIAAGLAAVAARYRHAWYLGVNLFLLIIAHASGVVLTLTEGLQGVVSAWLVAAATGASAVAMAAYLIWANPPLVQEMRAREYTEP